MQTFQTSIAEFFNFHKKRNFDMVPSILLFRPLMFSINVRSSSYYFLFSSFSQRTLVLVSFVNKIYRQSMHVKDYKNLNSIFDILHFSAFVVVPWIPTICNYSSSTKIKENPERNKKWRRRRRRNEIKQLFSWLNYA